MMLRRIALFILSIFFVFNVWANNLKRLPVPKILKQTKQIVLVITDSWTSTKGTLQKFQLSNINHTWLAVNKKPIHVVVGANGLGWSTFYKKYNLAGPYKKEGDMKSPAGIFNLTHSFGFIRATKRITKLPYIRLQDDTYCVDDALSKEYNKIITYDGAKKTDWRTGEQMHATKDYRYGIVVDYNIQNTKPHAGSCVFLHIWNGPNSNTAGCTAMKEKNVIQLLQWLNPKYNPVLIQLPRKQYELLKKQWKLP